MSESVTKLQNANATANVIHLQGKIDRCDPYEGKHYHEVILPAADEYSAPSRVKVVSTAPLGNVGQPIKVDCSIRGYVHTFKISSGVRAGQQGRDVKSWLVPIGDIG